MPRDKWGYPIKRGPSAGQQRVRARYARGLYLERLENEYHEAGIMGDLYEYDDNRDHAVVRVLRSAGVSI